MVGKDDRIGPQDPKQLADEEGRGHPRGSGQLVLFSLLALTSLVLIAAAGTRLAVLRRALRRANR